MHGITGIVTHLASASPQAGGANASSSQSGSSFQMALLTRPSSPSAAQAPKAFPSLASQTASVLLQTQDLTQAHGGGGGGHHGAAKTMPGLEAEEAGESEEAQLLQRRKKLAKTTGPSDVSETAEVDENGIARGVDQSETDRPEQEDRLDSATG